MDFNNGNSLRITAQEDILSSYFTIKETWSQCKDSSEGLGEDRGVFPIESLVCFAYCFYFLFFWDICVQGSNV